MKKFLLGVLVVLLSVGAILGVTTLVRNNTDKQNDEVNALKEDINIYLEQVVKLKGDLELENVKVTTLTNTITEKDESIKVLEDTIIVKDNVIVEKEAEVKKVKEEVVVYKDRVVTLEKTIETKTEEVKILEQEAIVDEARIKELEEQVEELQAQIKSLNSEINRLNGKVADLEAEIVSLNEEIDNLNSRIEELELENADLQAQLNQALEDINELNININIKTELIITLEARVEELENQLNTEGKTYFSNVYTDSQYKLNFINLDDNYFLVSKMEHLSNVDDGLYLFSKLDYSLCEKLDDSSTWLFDINSIEDRLFGSKLVLTTYGVDSQYFIIFDILTHEVDKVNLYCNYADVVKIDDNSFFYSCGYDLYQIDISNLSYEIIHESSEFGRYRFMCLNSSSYKYLVGRDNILCLYLYDSSSENNFVLIDDSHAFDFPSESVVIDNNYFFTCYMKYLDETTWGYGYSLFRFDNLTNSLFEVFETQNTLNCGLKLDDNYSFFTFGNDYAILDSDYNCLTYYSSCNPYFDLVFEPFDGYYIISYTESPSNSAYLVDIKNLTVVYFNSCGVFEYCGTKNNGNTKVYRDYNGNLIEFSIVDGSYESYYSARDISIIHEGTHCLTDNFGSYTNVYDVVVNFSLSQVALYDEVSLDINLGDKYFLTDIYYTTLHYGSSEYHHIPHKDNKIVITEDILNAIDDGVIRIVIEVREK